MLRGLKTLHVRMQRHCTNGEKIAHWLRNNPKVDKVYWAGFEDHPNHEIAKKQMRDFGGMLSVEIRGGREAALAVAAKVRLFTNATSLGGCESLIEHRASVEGEHPLSPQNLLRLSVGLEHADDLVDDLAQALGSTTALAGRLPGPPSTRADAPRRPLSPHLARPLGRRNRQ